MDISKLLKQRTVLVNRVLEKSLPRRSSFPTHLAQAIRYSVFSGGKRVRPFLVLESARLCGGSVTRAMPLACAVEMIHTYSLVHDDLPAMDDDEVRRGKAACHKKYDEATAILAGDALLSHAFEVIARSNGLSVKKKSHVIQRNAHAIGPYGMVAGQAADLKYRAVSPSLATVNLNRNRMKERKP